MTGLDWVAAENPGDWVELDWVWVKLDWVWVEVTGSGLGTIAGNGSADWPGPSLPSPVDILGTHCLLEVSWPFRRGRKA